ncbi:MAG: glycine oxidase ThiO, partial [Thermoanaerobaculia bacterium]
RVTLLEAGEPGREASWASAGMVAPQLEGHPGGRPFFEACRRSRGLYPDFVRALEEEAGLAIGFGTGGSIGVALRESEMETMRRSAAWQREQGLGAQVLGETELRRRLPGVSPRALGGVFFPEDAWVDNRRLMKALIASLHRSGITLHTGEPVLRFTGSPQRVDGVRTPHGNLSAGLVIDAAGAWASSISGIPPGELHVEPVRGQMVMLGAADTGLRSVVHSEGVYLVPRGPHQLLVGSTVEKAGFDRRVTAGGMARLLRRAVRLLPALKQASVLDAWCGFRPYAGRRSPVFKASRRSGLWYATGHFRNGILLAPLTAVEVAGRLAGARQPRRAPARQAHDQP